VFYIPGQFYEYVTYMNPDLGNIFFFPCHEQSKVGSDRKELGAYESNSRSLKLLKPERMTIVQALSLTFRGH